MVTVLDPKKEKKPDFVEVRCGMFDREILRYVMSYLEQNFQISLRKRTDVYEDTADSVPGESCWRDKNGNPRYFTLRAEFQVPTREMVRSNFAAITKAFGEGIATKFLDALRQAGARPGDLLLVIADPETVRPVRSFQLLPPLAENCQVRVKFWFALPERLPDGLNGTVIL